jgi:hypothetical protein
LLIEFGDEEMRRKYTSPEMMKSLNIKTVSGIAVAVFCYLTAA